MTARPRSASHQGRGAHYSARRFPGPATPFVSSGTRYIRLINGALMNHDNYPDSYIRGILNTVKTIAMVGISPKDVRPSYFAFKYLLEHGYRMIPVNPGQAGGELLGQKVYAKLADIPEPIDMVDVFRAPQYVPAIVEEASFPATSSGLIQTEFQSTFAAFRQSL